MTSDGNASTPPWLEAALRLKDEPISLQELADRVGVPVTVLASEFKRRKVERRVRDRVDADADAERAERGGADDGATPGRRKASKDSSIESFFELLGQIPDSEVAKRAAVSVRTIASYRARHEIPGYAGPRRRPPPRGRRQSRVDDFTPLLGRVPDRVVADVAGMSLGAVRNYRIKRDIPAAGRLTRHEIDQLVEAWRRGPTPAPAVAADGGAALPADGGDKAWRCRLHGDDTGFIVVADGLRAAVERALAVSGDESRIAAFELLGTVLRLP